MTPHLDREQWLAFFEQRLAANEHDAALEHISSCPQCAGIFKAARTAALDSVRAGEAPAATRRPIAALVLAGATISIVVIATTVMLRNPSAPARETAAPPSAIASVPASRPAIVKPPIVIGAEQLLVPRGDNANTRYLDALAAALKPYERDAFPEAIVALRPLADAYEDKFEPRFYLGASLLMSGRIDESILELTRAAALASPARQDEVARLLIAADQARRR